MCGIVFVLKSESTSGCDYQRACAAVQHRGPDATGVLDSDSFWCAFHRLMLVGRHAGSPLLETDDYVLVCNGEIYNYQDFDVSEARTDTEVIAKIDESQWDDLDGDFAFVLYLKKEHRFVAARSQIGVYPLYYAMDGSGDIVAFASEAKALRDLGLPGLSLHAFPPGGKVSWTEKVKPKDIVVRTINPTPTFFLNPDQDLSTVCTLLHAAVEKRLRHVDDSAKVAVLCSGGVDSSIITAMAVKLLPGIKIFTVQYAQGVSYDVIYSNLALAGIGAEAQVYKFDLQEALEALPEVIRVCETHDSRTIRAAIPGYLLAKKIAENHPEVKVVLSGEGADELFGGYKYFGISPNDESTREERLRIVSRLHSFDLLRADRVFAAFGMELRVPFLDRNLLQHVLRTEFAARVYGVEKWVLREAVRTEYESVIGPTLDRVKECFSDGCGSSYVPHLLSALSNNAKNLAERESIEQRLCEETFDSLYGSDNRAGMVLERTMPDWIHSYFE